MKRRLVQLRACIQECSLLRFWNPSITLDLLICTDPDAVPMKRRRLYTELVTGRTALGEEIRGEGLISLVRGFMYAGSPRGLASIWNVKDQATSETMRQFYAGMLRDRLSPGAALRAAQVWMSRDSR